MLSRKAEISGGYHLKNLRKPPGFITETLQPAGCSPADAAVGWTAVEEGLAAAQRSSRCWAMPPAVLPKEGEGCPFRGAGVGGVGVGSSTQRRESRNYNQEPAGTEA